MEGPSHLDKQLSSCANPWTDMRPLLDEFDSDSVEDEFALADSEIEERLGGPKLSKLTKVQQMSTIMVNLRVSCELLQQASRSLDIVEKHFQLDHQLDAVARLSDAPPSICTDSPCASSFTSVSTPSTKVSGVSLAVGPGLKLYSPLPYSGVYWAKNLESQFLTRDWELLSKEELALWMSHFPAEQQQNEPGSTYHSAEDLSQYRSALGERLSSFLCDKKQQQTSRSEENADGTVKLFQPTTIESLHLDALNTKYGLDNNPGGAQAPYQQCPKKRVGTGSVSS